MKYAADFRQSARTALAGRWGISLAVTLVAVLLGSFAGGGFKFNFTADANDFSGIFGSGEWTLSAIFARLGIPAAGLLAAVASLGGLLSFYGFAVFVIGGAIELGHNLYYIRLICRENPGMDSLFSRFEVFLKALGLRLFMSLFIFLWSLLLIIPGIIAIYRYRMATYLMAEHPEMGIQEAVNESKRLMEGYKGRWFCLDLSFIGWAFLCLLTFGIGYLWLNPYTAAANASFYLNVLSERNGNPNTNDNTRVDYGGPERL